MIITRENLTLRKTKEIEKELLNYLIENHEEINLIEEKDYEDLEFEISYFLIERDCVKINVDFYRIVKGSKSSIWVYKKYLEIKNDETLERIEILTSYE